MSRGILDQPNHVIAKAFGISPESIDEARSSQFVKTMFPVVTTVLDGLRKELIPGHQPLLCQVKDRLDRPCWHLAAYYAGSNFRVCRSCRGYIEECVPSITFTPIESH